METNTTANVASRTPGGAWNPVSTAHGRRGPEHADAACAPMPSTPLHGLPGIALCQIAEDLLSPDDRRQLAMVNVTLFQVLHNIVTHDDARRHAGQAVTLSSLRRSLAEIARLDSREQLEPVSRLAARNAVMRPCHRRQAVQEVLAFAKQRSPELVAAAIRGFAPTIGYPERLGPLLRMVGLTDTATAMYRLAWTVTRELPLPVRGSAIGALFTHAETRRRVPMRVGECLDALRAPLSAAGRAEALIGLAELCRIRRDTADNHDDHFEAMLELALALPVEVRHAPLAAVAGVPLGLHHPHDVVARWSRLMHLADTRGADDRKAICEGACQHINRMPAFDRRLAFDELWRRCERSPWREQIRTLTLLANLSKGPGLDGYGADDVIDVCLLALTPWEMLRPLETLLATREQEELHFESDFLGHGQMPEDVHIRLREVVLAFCRSLPPVPQGRLLSYCARGLEQHAPGRELTLVRILAMIHALPAEARAEPLAGVLHHAGQRPAWVEAHVLPLIEDIPLHERGPLLPPLLAFAVGTNDVAKTQAILLSPATWQAIGGWFARLPPQPRVVALRQMIGAVRYPGSQPWQWALAQVAALPAAYRPELLIALTRDRRVWYPSSQPFRAVVDQVNRLPAFLRAPVLDAVSRANAAIGTDGRKDYWICVFRIALARMRLPRADWC